MRGSDLRVVSEVEVGGVPEQLHEGHSSDCVDTTWITISSMRQDGLACSVTESLVSGKDSCRRQFRIGDFELGLQILKSGSMAKNRCRNGDFQSARM